MTTLPQAQIDELIYQFQFMEKDELLAEAQKISMSDIDQDSRRVLNNAIDLYYAALTGIDTTGLVVNSEVTGEEMRED